MSILQARFEEESRAKSAAHDALLAADRRAHASQNALEEARTLLDQADRARRALEQELADTNETLSEQTCTNQALTAAKRKCEMEADALGVGFSSPLVDFFQIFFHTPCIAMEKSHESVRNNRVHEVSFEILQ